MKAINRKLLRDLTKQKGQVFSISLLVACGVMSVVGIRSTYEAVRDARDRYYDVNRFAHVFAALKRAPESLADRIAGLAGVGAVQTRVVLQATVQVPGLEEPAIGQFVSIPSEETPMANQVHILRGRYVAPDGDNEVLVSTVFASANTLAIGDSLGAVINGRWQQLRIVGIATSPEYLYEIGGNALFVDNRRFGILWMRRDALAAAAAMEGAFNNVALLLAPRADERPVIQALDRLLAPYGGVGAVGRPDQPSNNILDGELQQLRATARIFPMFFLGIAAFLLNVVLGRLIETQRREIGALKAFGYTDGAVGVHFMGFAVSAVIIGSMIGMAAGYLLGSAYTGVYRTFFGFPDLSFRIGWSSALVAIGLSAAASLGGAAFAVRKAMRLPPAEAMRPPSPSRFRPLLLERAGLSPPASPAIRMVMRNLERRPFRSLASMLGIALSGAVMIGGLFPFDAVTELLDIQFRRAQRDDVSVAFNSPLPARVQRELASLADVTRVELTRATLLRFRSGHRHRSAPVTGLEHDGILRTLTDSHGALHTVPVGGAVLTGSLAKILRVAPGDTVEVELLEHGSDMRMLQVAGIIEESIGFGAYMSRAALNELLHEGNIATGANLTVNGDPERLAALLRQRPGVSGVASRASLLAYFERTIAESILIAAAVVMFAAVAIAAGVVYNGARIALSERGRELATLRVLGFTRREVSTFFLAEQGVITAAGLPVSAAAGYALALLLAASFETDRFSFPVTIDITTYFLAFGVVVAATVLVSLLVRRRIDKLDMIETLKVGE